MAKSTHPITYHYNVDGKDVAITRRHVGQAYARNGNVGNPTEYFVWDVKIDGEPAGAGYRDRSDAYEHARARVLGIPYVFDEIRKRYVNVRAYTLVRREMQANYVKREVLT
jgi:hypothetical protein